MKRLLLISALIICLVPYGSTVQAQEVEDAPARVEMRVFELQGSGLSSAYLQAIRNILREDYSQRADVQYDSKDRVLVVTATPLTLEKVERFLNKVDVPSQSLTFGVYVLDVKGKGMDSGIDADIQEELKEIDIEGARILMKARLETIPGEHVDYSMTPDGSDGDGYMIGFRPDGRIDNLKLSDFMVFRLVRASSKEGKVVFDQWKVLETSFAMTAGKPVVVGISGKRSESVVLVVKLLDK